MGDQETETPGPSTDRVVKELTDVRRRGLSRLDEDRKTAPPAAPTLEAMARAQAAAEGPPATSRPALLGDFLDRALTAFAEQGDESEARFIRRLFFDPGGKVKSATELKLDAIKMYKLTETTFDVRRVSSFKTFADFLIATYGAIDTPPNRSPDSNDAMTSSQPHVEARVVNAPPPAGPEQDDHGTTANPTPGSKPNAAERRVPPWLIISGSAVAVAVIVIVLVVVRANSMSSQTDQVTSSAPIGSSGLASTSSAIGQPFLTFDSLGGSGSQVIQVYAGPGETPGDRRVTGTYMSGTDVPVSCQAKGRMVSSDTSAGEPDRSFDIWLRIAGAPGPPQFATLTYASMDPAMLAQLPPC